MAKLLDKNGAEMCAALVEIAGPIRSFLNDAELVNAFRESTKKGAENELHDMLAVYADLVPILFNDKHRNDTLTILAVVEGTTVRAMLKKNGTELLKDALDAWNQQIKPFFTQLGTSA